MSSALTPTEQKTVLFRDDDITAVIANGRVYVPIRPICANLGIAWTAQRQRILRDPVLSEAVTPVITTITGTGQEVESLCLPFDMLQSWVDGINAARLKSGARRMVVSYQSSGEYRERAAYVYVIEASEVGSDASYYKIGRTCGNTSAYLRRLQMRNPLPLSLAFTLECSEPVSYRAEALLHDTFSLKRMHGEWFLLDSNDIDIVKEVIYEQFGAS